MTVETGRKPDGTINSKSIYILGVDIARSGKDETAFVVLEKLAFQNNIFLSYIETIDKSDLVQVIGRIVYLDKLFRFKKIIIDETGLGAGVCDVVKEKIGNKVEGIWYTQKSKSEIFTNLKLLLERKDGGLLIPDYMTTNDPLIRKLFYQFLSIQRIEREGSLIPKFTHNIKEHDDIINALCLAAHYFKSSGNIKKKGYFITGIR